MSGSTARRVEVLALRGAEAEARALYTIISLHGAAGARIVLDLSRGEGAESGESLPETVGRLADTARGNDQELWLLQASPALPPCGETGRIAEIAEALGPAAGAAAGDLDFDLGLPCEDVYVPPLRAWFGRRVSASFGAPPAFRMEVVLHELCMNAIENSPSPLSRFGVSSRLERGVITLRITNTPHARDGAGRIIQRRLGTFDDSGAYLEERGRGLFLVARMADGLRVLAPSAERITVVAWKDLSAPPEDGPCPASEGVAAPEDPR